jgi:hypothetical protein
MVVLVARAVPLAMPVLRVKAGRVVTYAMAARVARAAMHAPVVRAVLAVVVGAAGAAPAVALAQQRALNPILPIHGEDFQP